MVKNQEATQFSETYV